MRCLFFSFFFTPLEPSAEESHGTSLDLTNGPFYHARSQKDTWLVYIMIFLTFKFPQTLYSSLLSNKYLLLHWFWTSNPVGGGKSTAHNLYHVLTTDSTSGLWQQKYEKKARLTSLISTRRPPPFLLRSADVVNTSFELYRSTMQ